MKFEPITGNEMEIDGFQVVVHKPDYDYPTNDIVGEAVNKAVTQLQKTFEGEFGHKIVRVSHQYGYSSFLVNAGFEENLYNDIAEYMKKSLTKYHLPMVFVFKNFLSFSPLRDVNSDTDA